MFALRLAAAVRLHNGATIAPRARGAPPMPVLELFEYEPSPYCRLVRETLCVLGLRATIFPCPRETLRREGAYSSRATHRAEVRARGGRLAFPYLHDRTAGVALNESGAICAHLWRNYGADVERPVIDRILNGGVLPRFLEFGWLAAPSGLRPLPSHGLMAAPARQPEHPLVLHSCEPDPGCRMVREVLCTLQIAYESQPVSMCDSSSLPHLEDPNTGFRGFGARAIVTYLEDTYRLGPTLGLDAEVPEPNLGDADRSSWLTLPIGTLFPPAVAAPPDQKSRGR